MVETQINADARADWSAHADIIESVRLHADAATFNLWLDSGRRLTRSRRGFAAQFFGASKIVRAQMATKQFDDWAMSVAELTREYAELAPDFIIGSAAGALPPRLLNDWAKALKKIYASGERGRRAAVRLLQSMREVATCASPYIYLRLCELTAAVARKRGDYSERLLESALADLRSVNERLGGVIDVVAPLAQKRPSEAVEIFGAATAALANRSPLAQAQILHLIERLGADGASELAPFLRLLKTARRALAFEHFNYGLSVLNKLALTAPAATTTYLTALIELAPRMSLAQLKHWSAAALARDGAEGLERRFDLRGRGAKRFAEGWLSAATLDEIKPLMQTYCRALTDATLEIDGAATDLRAVENWVDADAADKLRLALPSVINEAACARDNFAIYKIACTHQAGYVALGTREFDFERASDALRDLRPALWREMESRALSGERAAPIETLLSVFADRDLIKNILNIVENARVDYLMQTAYPGLAREYAVANALALKRRPAAAKMDAGDLALELMARRAVGQTRLNAPRAYRDDLTAIMGLLDFVKRPDASVELAAEIACRVYAIVKDMRPRAELDADGRQRRPLNAAGVREYAETKADYDDYLNRIIRQMPQPQTESEPDGETRPSLSRRFEPAPHWGASDVEKMQAPARLRQANATPEQAGEALDPTPYASAETDALADQPSADSDAPPLNTGSKINDYSSPAEDTEPTPDQAPDEAVFRYDEWDCYAMMYKSDWCAVRELTPSGGDNLFQRNMLAEYGDVFYKIKRQFEALAPDLYAKRRRLPEGDEIDIDAAVNAIVDLRCKLSPDEKIYWKTDRRERSIAVAFLVDISASTAESINFGDDLYRNGRHSKSILDLEKASIGLMALAIELLGDTFGVYAFSGYGRDNVEVHAVKELDDRRAASSEIIARLGTISPSHATRMGAAIRHVSRKLAQCEEVTKILFLLSDGRPQDKGYSRDGSDREYAVQDTRMALSEARSAGVNPFCLTVDREGNGYLGEMMSGFGYEVLDDITELPVRLPLLYKFLTANAKAARTG